METLTQSLLKNDVWTFWSSDWKKKLTVKWNGNCDSLKPFYKRIRKALGTNFGYERSVRAVVQEVKIDIIIK